MFERIIKITLYVSLFFMSLGMTIYFREMINVWQDTGGSLYYNMWIAYLLFAGFLTYTIFSTLSIVWLIYQLILNNNNKKDKLP